MFVDLEKAFDRIPRSVLWWAMRLVGADDWLVGVVQAMYKDSKSYVRVNGSCSSSFDVTVGVHQGSVLSPLLFVIVMEALSRDFRHGFPWEMLYADDLVITADNLDDLRERFGIWKTGLENRGLRINVKKTKIMHSSYLDDRLPRKSGKFPCGVCLRGVGRNSIYCSFCKHWVHRKCSKVRGQLKEDQSFKCSRCRGDVEDLAEPESRSVQVGADVFEVATSFCYLGDMIGQSGGCQDGVVTRVRCAWKNFRELLPILTDGGIPFKTRGHVFNMCVRSILIYASETWPLNKEDMDRLIRNENAMVRWISSKRLADRVPMEQLRARLGLLGLDIEVRRRRLRWYGHIQRMTEDAWPKKVLSFDVAGRNPRGRPKKRWHDNIYDDLRKLDLLKVDPQDRTAWRNAIHRDQHSTASNHRNTVKRRRKTRSE